MSKKPADKPSKKHLEVLSYLVKHVEFCGYQPNLKEMAEHFQVTPHAIVQRLRYLESFGLVQLPGNRTERAVRITGLRFLAYPVENESENDN